MYAAVVVVVVGVDTCIHLVEVVDRSTAAALEGGGCVFLCAWGDAVWALVPFC